MRREETRKQMECLQSLVEGVQRQSEAVAHKSEKEKDVRVAKLTDNDDIEAYLTTFERQMRAYEVRKERWAYKLAPHLAGKAQQAYAGMRTEDAGDYEQVKEAAYTDVTSRKTAIASGSGRRGGRKARQAKKLLHASRIWPKNGSRPARRWKTCWTELFSNSFS